MANVSVLLHLGDRKKVVSVPSNCTDHYKLLCETVVEWTGESVEYFERFDSDWDEWIEVENDFQASNKDRIKAVLPTHADATGSSEVTADKPLDGITKNEELQCSSLTATDVDVSSGNCSTEESESDEEVELTFEQRRQRNIRELEAVKRQLGLLPSTPCRRNGSAQQPRKINRRPLSPVSVTSLDLSEPEDTALVIKPDVKTEGPITQKKAFKRERTAETPLPSPFPLPHHFPSTVEAGLIAQNPTVIPKYLSCVASSMLCHKLYPTREEYVQVAVEIVNKHGWMKSKLGPPTGAIVTSLQNRFKEFRRDRKAMKPDTSDGENIPKTPARTKKPAVQKSPSIAWMQPPPIPPGEDACSFDRFSSQLRDEAKRRKPRNEVTTKLMEATYAQRRKDILECPAAIPELLKKYPFLGNEDELLKDLERLAGKENLASEIRSSWSDTWAPRIMQLQYDAQKSSVRSHITANYDPENADSLSLAALCTLCCVARDSRTKATYKNVVYFVPEISDPQQVAAELNQPQPLLVVEGTLESPKRCFIMAEETSVLQGEVTNAIAMLLASFFVFNIHYPPGLSNFYTVLEVLMLRQVPKKCPIIVSNVLSQLNYGL